MSWFVVSVHDVGSASAEPSRRWLDLFEARDIRVSVLVIPGPWQGCGPLDDDQPLGAWLRSLQTVGHDIVQHGWMHAEPDSTSRGYAARAAGRLAARDCAEFWHVEYAEASRRLALGRAAMAAAGLCASGFVAPGWLMSPGARSAVTETGFSYTASHTSVSALRTGQTWQCPVLSQRPGSLISQPVAHATTTVARWRVNFNRPLRIAVHPADLDDRRTTDAALRSCDLAREAGYQSLTYADVVAGRIGVGPVY